ncbi:hypothetical protein BJV78DRAFT_1284126 [Lactifluus subvellereus]|nr:hypothetical protein BJV78DRAFT_1284126 [Lactifluus subvellereus]
MAEVELQLEQDNRSLGNRSSRSILPQLQDNVRLNATVQHAADHGQGRWGDILPPAGNVATQGGLQDPHPINVVHYDMGHHPPLPPPGGPVLPYMYHNVGVAQGFPAQPERANPELGYAAQHVAPGPAQAAFPDPSVQHIPVPDQLAAENLRRLANRFLHHPDSQIEVVLMEPGPAGRFKVMISLEIADFM